MSPELSEVETFKNYFDTTSLNQKIKNVVVRDNRILKIQESSFMKNILEAELKHKLELLELGIENVTPPEPDDCIACSG